MCSFCSRTVNTEWYIIQERCEPVLSGKLAEQLGIIKFNNTPAILTPINVIKSTNKKDIQDLILVHKEMFQGIGKLKGHQVWLHKKTDIKPVVQPPRRVPYHLQEIVSEVLQKMLDKDIA